MLTFDGLSIFPIIVVWVIYLVVGSFWYSPAGFGKLWSRLSGVDMMKTPKNETTRAIIFVALSSIVQVFVLDVLLNSLSVDSVLGGILISLFIWFGMTALTTVGNTLYQRQGWKFLWLNAAYFFVVMAIGGAILSVWR